MIRQIEALNFRCLRYICQPLGNFQVLVGPNASGKTTFLDGVAFLSDLVREGLEYAVQVRTSTFDDLVWQRLDAPFELAIELEIPKEKQKRLREDFRVVRYEVRVGPDDENRETSILAEKVVFSAHIKRRRETQGDLFPQDVPCPETIVSPKGKTGTRTVVNKVPGGNDNFYSEVEEGGGKGWAPSFRLGPRRSALGNLPEDERKFPVSTWLKNLLTDGMQRLILNSQAIRKASPPGQVTHFKPDGANVPWVIERFRKTAPDRFQEWLKHVRTALPDIEDIRTVERPDDRHRYLVIGYAGGLEVPSWVASDGTLRLLALTLLAYLPDFRGVYLIEEPENGIHPQAVETMFQSLSSAYDAQILLATHSPVILSVAKPSQVLCFSKTASGAVDVVRGDEHPALRDWKGEENLGVLFAGGVLS